jgi:hypothetical protein
MELQNEMLIKVDEVRKRKKVSYEEAKNALEMAGNDVLEAIIYLENLKQEKFDEIRDYKEKTVESIRKTTSEMVDFSYRGKSVEAPLPVVAIGTLLVARKPKILASAIGALLIFNVDVKLKKDNREIELTKPVREKFIGMANALGLSKVGVTRKMDDFTKKIHFKKEVKQEDDFEGYFSSDLY